MTFITGGLPYALSTVTNGDPLTPAYMTGLFSPLYSNMSSLNSSTITLIELTQVSSPALSDLTLNSYSGSLVFQVPSGTTRWLVRLDNSAIAPDTDNVYDIGLSATVRPRVVQLATKTSVPRIKASGTTHPIAKWTITGWGSGATIQSVTGTDTGATVQILCGSSPSANPLATVIWSDGTWPGPSSPLLVTSRGELNSPTAGYWSAATSATTFATFKFVGTPLNTFAYILHFHAMGRP